MRNIEQSTHIPPTPSKEGPSRALNSETLLSPAYRFSVSEQLARSTGCDDVILFDHISPTDPSLGKRVKTPLGYEKCLVPAVPLTSAMRAHVLMQAPPLPAEMAFVDKLYKTVPDAKGLHVWLPNPDKEDGFIDGFALYRNDEKAYENLVKDTLANPPAGSSTFHVEATPRLLEQEGLGKTLVLPFQTMDWHKNKLDDLVANDKIVLPDSADQWLDKGEAHKYFEEHDTGDLRPESISVSMDDIRQPTVANIVEAASRVENACNEMTDAGKIPFVKLAGNGLAGFGIVTPAENPLLDENIPLEDRSKHFHATVEGILDNTPSISDAVVEEYVKIAKDEAGKKEYILSGIVIGNEFQPWSISRSITDDRGVYQGVIVSPIIEELGLNQDSLQQALEEGQRMGQAMSEGGYNTGYIAKDFIVTENADGTERHVYHDDNDRRGGRTNADHASALLGEGFCDRSVMVTIPEDVKRSTFLLELTGTFRSEGLEVYGTGSVYTGTRTVTLRVLSPLSQLRDNAGETNSLQDFGNNAVERINSIIETTGQKPAEHVLFQK